MNLTSAGPILRPFATAGIVLLLGLFLAAQTGKGNLVVPIYFLIGVVVLRLRQLFVKHFRLEALILGLFCSATSLVRVDSAISVSHRPMVFTWAK
jgi:hypothetical protein